MKTITISIPDSLDDETIKKATDIFRAWAVPEWLILLKFYRAQKYEIHNKGDGIEIKAMVWK